MNINKKYTICTKGGSSPCFLNGHFPEEQVWIPGKVGQDEYYYFFDEGFNTNIYIRKENVIWIKEAK